jgi:hypothetical protein
MTASERPVTRRQDVVRRSVQRRSRNDQSPTFVVAVDLGISRNFTALVLLKRVECQVDETLDYRDPARNPVVYHVLHLKRFPLGTESPVIIEFISQLMARRTLAGRTGLVVDASGIGMPIVKEMRRCGLNPVPITFTPGGRTRRNNVPKRDLVSGLLLLFQQSRIRIPSNVKLRAELIEEFNNFILKYTQNGNPTFSAAAGAHDDLIMALSLACYFLENRRGLPRVHATVVGSAGNRISSALDLERFLQDRMLYR